MREDAVSSVSIRSKGSVLKKHTTRLELRYFSMSTGGGFPLSIFELTADSECRLSFLLRLSDTQKPH